MRKFNKILSFVIVIILIVGIVFFIYLIWITPVSKASKIKTSINYAEEIDKTTYTKEMEVIYIKIDSEPELEKETKNNVAEKNTQTVSNKADKERVKKIEVKNQNNTVSNQTQIPKTTVTKITYPDGWIQSFNSKIAQLKKEYPSGSYWNHAGNGKNGGITTTPCNHKQDKYYCNTYQGKSTMAYGIDLGCQCAGFASMLSDRVFGKDAPVRIFYNYDEIRVGDQARINNNSHTVFIIEKTDDYVVVAECNADYKTCVINWGRKIYRNQLKGFYLTRYQN